MLPFMGSEEYLVTSNRRSLSRNRWLEVLLTLRGLVECIDVDGLPGWTTSPNDNGILLLLPSTSEMARRWSYGKGFLGASNETSLGLIKAS